MRSKDANSWLRSNAIGNLTKGLANIIPILLSTAGSRCNITDTKQRDLPTFPPTKFLLIVFITEKQLERERECEKEKEVKKKRKKKLFDQKEHPIF